MVHFYKLSSVQSMAKCGMCLFLPLHVLRETLSLQYHMQRTYVFYFSFFLTCDEHGLLKLPIPFAPFLSRLRKRHEWVRLPTGFHSKHQSSSGMSQWQTTFASKMLCIRRCGNKISSNPSPSRNGCTMSCWVAAQGNSLVHHNWTTLLIGITYHSRNTMVRYYASLSQKLSCEFQPDGFLCFVQTFVIPQDVYF